MAAGAGATSPRCQRGDTGAGSTDSVTGVGAAYKTTGSPTNSITVAGAAQETAGASTNSNTGEGLRW